MANKKAKSKTSKKKTAPVNKKTVTRVVSSKTVAKEAKEKTNNKANVFIRFFDYLLTPNTIRMIALELIGSLILAMSFVLTQGHPMYMIFVFIGVYTTLSYSTGGFFNPAFSFGAWVTRKISGAALIIQIIAQTLGVMLSLVTHNVFSHLLPDLSQFKLKPIVEGNEWYIFGAEILGLMILALFLGRMMKRKANNSEKAIALGFGIFTALLIAGAFANYASGMIVLNPSLLIQLHAFPSANWMWIISAYIIAPLIGGALGFLLADVLEEKASAKIK